MRLQNSASHVVCHEKFSFIILSIALSAHPRLHILALTPGRSCCCRAGVCLESARHKGLRSLPELSARTGLDAVCSVYTGSAKCAVKIMFAKLGFEEKRNEMEKKKQITPCYSSLEEARRKWVFANICIFLMMGGTLMIKSVGWEQRTGSAEQTL